MSKGKAIILGIFTAFPPLYVVFFFGTAFVDVMTDFWTETTFVPRVIFPLHLFTILETFALMAIYIHNLFKTDRVPQDKKALWASVLLLGHMLTMPVYWYHYIWKEGETPEDDG